MNNPTSKQAANPAEFGRQSRQAEGSRPSRSRKVRRVMGVLAGCAMATAVAVVPISGGGGLTATHIPYQGSMTVAPSGASSSQYPPDPC